MEKPSPEVPQRRIPEKESCFPKQFLDRGGEETETPDPQEGSGVHREGWRRSTLPPPLSGSTIDAAGLNDRVRNGNGCGPRALVVSHK